MFGDNDSKIPPNSWFWAVLAIFIFCRIEVDIRGHQGSPPVPSSLLSLLLLLRTPQSGAMLGVD
jgi:hypothetical protein